MSKPTALSPLGQAAVKYAHAGWPVFPCEVRGKKPLCEHGLKDASTKEETIRAWWGQWPDANIGFATGERVVLDIDGPEGETALVGLENRHGKMPATLTARTGREGGKHLYFAANGAQIRNSAGRLGPHLDTRGLGGYTIVPPSVHENGKRYEWVDAHVKPAHLPVWFAALLAQPARSQTEAEGADGKIPEGQRNAALTSLAGAMRRSGATETVIAAALLAENKLRCDPHLAESEVRQIAESIGRYSPGAKPASGLTQEFPLVHLRELLAQPETAVDWVWKYHLAAGTMSGVFSKPKVGKSTFARNLCLAVARGDDFLGLPVKKGLCVYLALEERKEEVTADFRAMGATGEEPIFIHADPIPAAGILALVSLVQKYKPALVVIDPLFRMIHVKDEKSYAEMYAALGPLVDLARSIGTHLLTTHHAGKSLKVDPIDSPLGSTAIGGAASTAVVLKRTDNYRTIETVQRFGRDLPETVLAFDPGSRRLSLGAGRAEADAALMGEKILTFMESAGEAKSEEEITEAVEGRTTIVRKALRKLVNQGKVTREGGGKKGNPYKYSKCLFPCSREVSGIRKQESESAASEGEGDETKNLFSCSDPLRGTREQESEKGRNTLENTSRILVPGKSEKTILVPAIKEGEL